MLNALPHFAFIGPGGPEILVVMLVLLLMFGAKDAPRIFRKLNDILNQFRSTAESFKREVMYSDLGNDPTPDRTAGGHAVSSQPSPCNLTRQRSKIRRNPTNSSADIR